MININETLIIQLVNFLLLMFLLNRLLFKPMLRVLDERRERTEGRRQAAEQRDAQAEAVWADYQEKIQQARVEADRIRSDLIRRAEAERQKIVEEAAAEAEKNVAQIRARIQAEARDARAVLEKDARALAGGIAERILGRSV